MEDSSDHARVLLKITGRVQGVYFRASTVAQARRCGLTGWVMNCADGSVETIAEGSKVKIEDFIAWCRQGPPGAQVRQCAVIWQEPKGDFDDFKIRR